MEWIEPTVITVGVLVLMGIEYYLGQFVGSMKEKEHQCSLRLAFADSPEYKALSPEAMAGVGVMWSWLQRDYVKEEG